VTLQTVASLTDNAGVVIYNFNTFIKRATGYIAVIFNYSLDSIHYKQNMCLLSPEISIKFIFGFTSDSFTLKHLKKVTQLKAKKLVAL